VRPLKRPARGVPKGGSPGASLCSVRHESLPSPGHELGFVPLSKTGAELLFEVFSQRYERGSVLLTSNLPFDEWTEVFGSQRLTGALLDCLTHHVHILEMNGDSYRLADSRRQRRSHTPPKPPVPAV
jgi:hypothetical protein